MNRKLIFAMVVSGLISCASWFEIREPRQTYEGTTSQKYGEQVVEGRPITDGGFSDVAVNRGEGPAYE